MKIELGAGDGISHEDGKDRNIIAIIDGKQLILPVDKTVAQVLEIGERLSNAPIKNLIIAAPLDMRPGSTGLRPSEVIQVNNEIQVGDTITYQPKEYGGYTPQERCDQHNGRLKIGAQYRVLAFPEEYPDSVEIIDDSASTPARLPVAQFDVQLFRKNPKVHVTQKHFFELIVDCPTGCKLKGQPVQVVLTAEKGSDHYEGKCEECKTIIHAPYPTPDPKVAA